MEPLPDEQIHPAELQVHHRLHQGLAELLVPDCALAEFPLNGGVVLGDGRAQELLGRLVGLRVAGQVDHAARGGQHVQRGEPQRFGGLVADPLLVVGDLDDLPAPDGLFHLAGRGPSLKLELLCAEHRREGQAEILGTEHDRHFTRRAPVRPPEEDVVDVCLPGWLFFGGFFLGGRVQGIGPGRSRGSTLPGQRRLLFLFPQVGKLGVVRRLGCFGLSGRFARLGLLRRGRLLLIFFGDVQDRPLTRHGRDDHHRRPLRRGPQSRRPCQHADHGQQAHHPMNAAAREEYPNNNVRFS